MTSNREKATGYMGLVVSVLLHGIFFAGLFALDSSHGKSNVDSSSQIRQIEEIPQDTHKS